MVKEKDSVDKTQKEIQEEIAKALGNTGSQLESVLMQMKELERVLEQTEDTEKFNALVDEYNDLVITARQRKEMLVIHREAIGVLKHSYIEMFYPVPEKKKKRKNP